MLESGGLKASATSLIVAAKFYWSPRKKRSEQNTALPTLKQFSLDIVRIKEN